MLARTLMVGYPTAVRVYCLVVPRQALGCAPVTSRGVVAGGGARVAPGHRSVAYTILCRVHTPKVRRKILSLHGLVLCLSPTLDAGRRSGFRPPEHLLSGDERRRHTGMALPLYLRGMALEVDVCCQKTMPP